MWGPVHPREPLVVTGITYTTRTTSSSSAWSAGRPRGGARALHLPAAGDPRRGPEDLQTELVLDIQDDEGVRRPCVSSPCPHCPASSEHRKVRLPGSLGLDGYMTEVDRLTRPRYGGCSGTNDSRRLEETGDCHALHRVVRSLSDVSTRPRQGSALRQMFCGRCPSLAPLASTS